MAVCVSSTALSDHDMLTDLSDLVTGWLVSELLNFPAQHRVAQLAGDVRDEAHHDHHRHRDGRGFSVR